LRNREPDRSEAAVVRAGRALYDQVYRDKVFADCEDDSLSRRATLKDMGIWRGHRVEAERLRNTVFVGQRIFNTYTFQSRSVWERATAYLRLAVGRDRLAFRSLMAFAHRISFIAKLTTTSMSPNAKITGISTWFILRRRPVCSKHDSTAPLIRRAAVISIPLLGLIRATTTVTIPQVAKIHASVEYIDELLSPFTENRIHQCGL
jgi:hypothetical protein